jgi:hypothetical protein
MQPHFNQTQLSRIPSLTHALRPFVLCAALFWSVAVGWAQSGLPAGAQLVSPSAIPAFANFYSLHQPQGPPLPFLRPEYVEMGLPVYWLGGNRYLVDDTSLDWAAIEAERRLAQAATAALSASSLSLLGGGAALLGSSYSSNDLWLKISAITNQTLVLTVHPPVAQGTNGTYDIYFLPDLNWQRWQWRRVICGVPGQTHFDLPMPEPQQGYFVALDAADDDTDGLGNGYECWFKYGGQYTSPIDPDSDDDGLWDGWEVQYGLDPTSNAGTNGAAGNPDGDTWFVGTELMPFINQLEHDEYAGWLGAYDPLFHRTTATNRPVVTVVAESDFPKCQKPSFLITRHDGQLSDYSQPLTVYYALGGTLRYGADYALSPAPATESGDPEHPDGYPRIYQVKIPAGSTSVSLTVTPHSPTFAGSTQSVVLALTPYAVSPRAQVPDPLPWNYVVDLHGHQDRATNAVAFLPAPVLTAECQPYSIYLRWTLPEWLQQLAALGFITDFQIYRCSRPMASARRAPTPMSR